jgi:hypothetical protein
MATVDPGRARAVHLTPTVVREATRRAAACGLTVSAWLGQAVEAYLAGDRCQHGPPRPLGPEGRPGELVDAEEAS